MSNKNKIPISAVGNFTKNAVESFEEKIISEKDYLEKSGSIKVKENHK